MKKQGCFFLTTALLSQLLTGCVGQIWSGTMMVYDRHNLYEKLDDYQLSADVNRALFADRRFKRPDVYIDIATFNNDVLIAGHVPTYKMRREALDRLQQVKGYRDLYNQLAVSYGKNNTVQDSLITMQVRTRIFADSTIDPNAFKIVTCDRIVYVMGEVKAEQAATVLNMASNTPGVLRVVKLMKYYNLSKKPPDKKSDLNQSGHIALATPGSNFSDMND